MSNFRIGQKVVCIDDDSTPPPEFVVLSHVEHPKKGMIYTVKEFQIAAVSGLPCMLVEEIPDQIAILLHEGELCSARVLFRQNQFRPLVRRKSDISVFKSMLTPQNEQVPA